MTSIREYRNDNPRTASEIADAIEVELQQVRPQAAVADGTQNYALIQSIAGALENTEQSLAELYRSAYLTDATGEELTKKAREIGVQRQEAVAATGVVTFSRDSPATSDYVIPSGTRVTTGGDDPVTFTTTQPATLAETTTSVQANVRCTETGADGNIGEDTISAIASGTVSGVDSVTNPQPVGDPTYTLVDNQTTQTPGQSRESDTSLRDRALETTAIGGAGTAEATELAVENIPDVISADVVTNRSNSTTKGIEPWNTEVRVYGGQTTEIAQRLYEVLPLITLKTLQGGANGTKNEVTLTKPLYGEITVPITRPTITTLVIELSVVHDETYAGNDDVTDALISYVGGQNTRARDVVGRGQGENILINEIENVVEDTQGVEYAEVTLCDADDDGNDDTTTDSDGVPVYAVDDSEVARVDASAVTIQTTQR